MMFPCVHLVLFTIGLIRMLRIRISLPLHRITYFVWPLGSKKGLKSGSLKFLGLDLRNQGGFKNKIIPYQSIKLVKSNLLESVFLMKIAIR